MKRKIFAAAIVFFVCLRLSFAQIEIHSISPQTTFPNDTIVIVGSGFSSSVSDLDVWFGSVKGVVLDASEFAIEVRVPAQARAENLMVVNRTTNLSVISEMKFVPALKTESFAASKFAQVVSQTPLMGGRQNELFDLCVCDLNGDGKPDVATTKFERNGFSKYEKGEDLMILQNTSVPGTSSFEKRDRSNLAVLDLKFPTDNVICGDLNADGKPELIVSRAGSSSPAIHILKNISTGTTINFERAAPLYIDATAIATRIAMSDLNNDGKPELIVTNSKGDTFFVFVNQSIGSSLSYQTTPLKLDIDPTGDNSGKITYDVAVQDFNYDGWADIIVNGFLSNNFYIFKNLKSTAIAFAPVAEHKTAANTYFNRVASADFNSDKKLDLIFSNSLADKPSAIYLNRSTAENLIFAPDEDAIKITTSKGAWGVDVGDIDGDHDVDFAIAPKDATELNVFLNDGNQTKPGFDKHIIPLVAPQPRFPRNIKIGDLDGDGKPELTFTSQNDDLSITMLEVFQNLHCHVPEIQNAEPLTICNGQSIVLKTQQASNVILEWSKDGMPVGANSPFLTIQQPGIYRVTNKTNGCNTMDELSVTFDPGGAPLDPVINANTPLCEGATLTLSTNPSPGATFTWTRPDGSTLVGNNQVVTVTLADAGLYYLQITAGVCKSNPVSKRIDVASVSNFNLIPQPQNSRICQGGSLQISVTPAPNHTYEWTRNGAVMGLANNVTKISVADEANYRVKVRNSLLCETVTNAVIPVVLTTPVADLSAPPTACSGNEIKFENKSSYDNRGAVVYDWDFGDGTNSIIANPLKTYLTPGTFSTKLTLRYGDASGTGCSKTSNIKTVTVNETIKPVIQSSHIALCPEETASLSITGSFKTILWTDLSTASATVAKGPGKYSVNTTDGNNCEASDEITIQPKPVPEILATALPESIEAGFTSQLLASGGVSYSWTPVETLSDPLIANPIASPVETTTYSVTGLNAEGCAGTSTVLVTVTGVESFPVMFSPNDDGVNDIWNIGATTPDKSDCSLTIFDARGRRVFEGKGKNWDGRYQNYEVPDGTYFYSFGCPDRKPVNGSVLLIR